MGQLVVDAPAWDLLQSSLKPLRRAAAPLAVPYFEFSFASLRGSQASFRLTYALGNPERSRKGIWSGDPEDGGRVHHPLVLEEGEGLANMLRWGDIRLLRDNEAYWAILSLDVYKIVPARPTATVEVVGLDEAWAAMMPESTGPAPS